MIFQSKGGIYLDEERQRYEKFLLWEGYGYCLELHIVSKAILPCNCQYNTESREKRDTSREMVVTYI